jgi:hypothetical protein
MHICLIYRVHAVCSVFLDAVHIHDKEASVEQIRKKIRDTLRNSYDREGGRAERKCAKSNESATSTSSTKRKFVLPLSSDESDG